MNVGVALKSTARRALTDPDPAVRAAAAGCVPINLFGAGRGKNGPGHSPLDFRGDVYHRHWAQPPVGFGEATGEKLGYELLSEGQSPWSVIVNAGAGALTFDVDGAGSNTYPACSPDGRMVAFFSTRGGLYVSNPLGQNQQKIASVNGESLRWEGN